MMHRSFEFLSQLPAREAVERIGDLLSEEGVEYRTADLSMVSTRTPVAVLSIQPKLYSHNNWVGVNPFTFVSGIEVQCATGDNGLTKVTVRVDRLRAVLFAILGIVAGFLAAGAMPEPAGVLFFIGFACATWLGIVSCLGGYLVKKEIADRLVSPAVTINP